MRWQQSRAKMTLPQLLPIPLTKTSMKPRISSISVAQDGDHALLIAETGQVYFVGTSHRGEEGEGMYFTGLNCYLQLYKFVYFVYVIVTV